MAVTFMQQKNPVPPPCRIKNTAWQVIFTASLIADRRPFSYNYITFCMIVILP